MQSIQNQTFENQIVDIDDTTILDCVFIDCILRYSGRSFTIGRSQLLRCRYLLFGPAEETFRFLQLVGILDWQPQQWAPVTDRVQ